MQASRTLLASVVWLASCLMGCASTPAVWQARTVAGCATRLGEARLDQTRTYLATLLALSSRGYAIVFNEAPALIEAEVRSSYHPEVFNTRWVLRVQPDGSLEIDAPTHARQMHEKTLSWYENLRFSVAKLQCRDLNWLRWEAQNRGLLEVGADLGAPTSESSGGGEAPGAAVPESLDPGLGGPSPAARKAVEQRRDELRRQRAEVHLWRTVGWSAAGLGVMSAGIGLSSQALTYRNLDCEDSRESCSLRRAARGMGYAGVGLAVTGAIMLTVSLPILFRRKLPRYKALSRELKALQDPPLALGFGASETALNLTIRGVF